MALTYEQADRVLKAALAKSKELEFKMAIAVVDSAGELQVLGRMTGAGPGRADIASGKARVSAMLGRPSGEIAERMNERIILSMTVLHGGKLVYWQGAIPLKDGDTLIGAVGVSGSNAANDEIVAQAGADAL